MFLTTILIFLSIILCLKSIFSKWKLYVLSWNLPGPFAFPIIGNALEFWCDDDDTYEVALKNIARYPSPMRFWFGPKFAIVITDLDRASKIICSTNFLQKDEIYDALKEFAGEGLVSGSGPKWRRDRRAMAPIFSKKNIMKYFDNIVEHTNILIKLLEQNLDGPLFNIEKYLHRCVADFVSETILGVRTDAQNGDLVEFFSHVSRVYVIIHKKTVNAWLQVDWIYKLSGYWREKEEVKRIIHGILRNMVHEVEERRRKRDPLSEPFESVLDGILDIRDNDPSFANDDELIDHLATLYLASEDTTTTIAAFTVLLLGMHPEIQERAYTEVKEVIGDRKELILEDLPKLKYLQMCIEDVMRLFPIAPFIMRCSLEDFPLDDFVIPKGCSVLVSIHKIHRDPELWEKPNEFYPEHFLPEAVEKRHKFAFLAFSAGQRGCLGKPYAYLAVTILVAKIIRGYQIFADGKLEDIRLKMDISVRTRDHRYPVRISKRK